MGKLKELRNTNKLYERVIDEILEDSEDYLGNKKEKIVARCNEIIQHGCCSGTVSSMIYYSDTNDFYNTFSDEIYELIEELEKQGYNVLDCLKNDLSEVQIITCDNYAKNNIAWLVYEEIANKLLYILEEG